MAVSCGEINLKVSFLGVELREFARLVENFEVFENYLFLKKVVEIYVSGIFRLETFCFESAHQKFVVLFVAGFEGEDLAVVEDFGEVIAL